MDSAISSLPRPDRARALGSIAQLRRALERCAEPSVALLVIRLPALERTAWREGLRKARALEHRAAAAFAGAAARVIRARDTLAHDRGSDLFLAALTAPTRSGRGASDAIDARSALARIAASVSGSTGLESETGWTVTVPSTDDRTFDELIAGALRRGAQERERYAFFSAVGHELRTPLASIRGYLETLLDETAVDPRTRTRFLRITYNESLRLSRLVEGMFEISLLDLQAAFPPTAIGRLEPAVAAAVEACSARARTGAMTIVCDAPPPLVIGLDADRLTLVLVNLLENAIKHGRRGGCVRLSFATASDPDHACIIVDDDGPGIAAAERERLFSLGARGETHAAGSGIGLALVRLMLERIGGRVAVTDAPLGGARFCVTVPVAGEAARVV